MYSVHVGGGSETKTHPEHPLLSFRAKTDALHATRSLREFVSVIYGVHLHTVTSHLIQHTLYI